MAGIYIPISIISHGLRIGFCDDDRNKNTLRSSYKSFNFRQRIAGGY